ncbi:dipeptidase [Elizabethkingia anophelis]|uniref:Peptidase n=1 Tax=Elizabethkingia anophelis TaxID=1117645 RepID=A0A494J8W8_9FLAO|nr:membrane dipeptidase [Elizabethkingia anophelis]AQX51400.1 peptidase [Elizabethkingia anophelis]MCT3754002.1 membrane dipeptidase [Elizabethkingia anophelis]MCT3775532.1 membrane dipeptidase [Elizabethkingia anophelis]MCT3782405.1 membrane dipeptidase [Elizabethkingia anophelis]MCT3789640.1 membrane dipeptidase [Elizabethkingia anophelis]
MKNYNIDLHCDLLYYLLRPGTRIDDREIGCSLPFLKEGNVMLQVMALYTATAKGSRGEGLKQSEIFAELTRQEGFYLFDKEALNNPENQKGVGVIASLENASNFCEEDMDLDEGFENLEKIIENTKGIFYIGITHHHENRFGGGNFAEAGLKEDGKILIDYLSDKKIAIDLAHTSDQLAHDIFNYTAQRNYKIPILASHSNFRSVYPNNRNLPDELVKELIARKGLIGINFIKDYIHKTNPEVIYDHIAYGIDLGTENNLAYGGDFFYDKDHPDKSRYPFFFKGMDDATAYNTINERLMKVYEPEIVNKISHQNALRFIRELWE